MDCYLCDNEASPPCPRLPPPSPTPPPNRRPRPPPRRPLSRPPLPSRPRPSSTRWLMATPGTVSRKRTASTRSRWPPPTASPWTTSCSRARCSPSRSSASKLGRTAMPVRPDPSANNSPPDRGGPAALDYRPLIRDLPASGPPRQRLRHRCAAAPSNAELLAIIRRTGATGENVGAQAPRLLSRFNGLPGLARASVGELCAEHAVGEAKASQVL